MPKTVILYIISATEVFWHSGALQIGLLLLLLLFVVVWNRHIIFHWSIALFSFQCIDSVLDSKIHTVHGTIDNTSVQHEEILTTPARS